MERFWKESYDKVCGVEIPADFLFWYHRKVCQAEYFLGKG